MRTLNASKASLFAVVLVCGPALAQTQPGPFPQGASTPPGYPAPGSPAPSGAPAAPAEPPPLQAGGLAAPPSAPAPAPKVIQTEQSLAEAEREDSGRGLQFFFVEGAVGAEHVGLHTLSGSTLVVPSVEAPTQTGLVYGGSLGVRLLAFSIAARFRSLAFADHRLWTLGGRFGLHIPLGLLEPHVYVGGGYAAVPGVDAPSISGFDVLVGGGLDMYLSNVVSVGVDLSSDVLFLSRPADAAHAVPEYRAKATSVGLSGSLSAVLGLHF